MLASAGVIVLAIAACALDMKLQANRPFLAMAVYMFILATGSILSIMSLLLIGLQNPMGWLIAMYKPIDNWLSTLFLGR
ncbi:hypothetical protein ACFPVX_20560 [Cohnella faecalis]|uniref:hypothetical protein n=1 Tax=Cohnella faecalis TaxID=2315694 RepID=UPI0013145151|nr:hypothetical protein [Cohnella faecalis]